MDNPILPLPERAHNQTPHGIAQLLEQTLRSPNHIGDDADLAVDQGCWGPESLTQAENGPSGGAATGAVFIIGYTVGDVAPGRVESSNLGNNRSIAWKACPRSARPHFAAHELVRINLQISRHAAAQPPTSETIIARKS